MAMNDPVTGFSWTPIGYGMSFDFAGDSYNWSMNGVSSLSTALGLNNLHQVDHEGGTTYVLSLTDENLVDYFL